MGKRGRRTECFVIKNSNGPIPSRSDTPGYIEKRRKTYDLRLDMRGRL